MRITTHLLLITFCAIFRRLLKKLGEAWLSPPSAWIGSITIPATGFPFCLHFTIRSSTWKEQMKQNCTSGVFPKWHNHNYHIKPTNTLDVQTCLFTKQNTYFLQTASLLLSIFSGKFLQWVLQSGKWGNGPIKCRHVELVDGFGMCGGQATWTEWKYNTFEIKGIKLTGHRHFS